MGVDERLRRELGICEKYGISHSHYLGGPPTWTQDDRDKAEQFARWQSHVCARCGTHEDWWDPAAGGHREIMVPATRRCHGCQAIEDEQASIPKDQHGVHVYLTPNPALTVDRHGVITYKED